jgi:hypothetical protein
LEGIRDENLDFSGGYLGGRSAGHGTDYRHGQLARNQSESRDSPNADWSETHVADFHGN